MQTKDKKNSKTDVPHRLLINGEKFCKWWRNNGDGSPYPATKRKIKLYLISRRRTCTNYQSYRRGICSLKYHPQIGGDDPEAWEKSVWFSEEIQSLVRQHREEYDNMDRRSNSSKPVTVQAYPPDNNKAVSNNGQSCHIIQGPVQRGFVVSKNVKRWTSAPAENASLSPTQSKAKEQTKVKKSSVKTGDTISDKNENHFPASNYKWRNISVKTFEIPVPSYDPYTERRPQYTGKGLSICCSV
ncbi:hypothetical protein BCR43DRAFT_486177 [Syncephalastrum racemosum]|uniref:Uncharacterized protein n=1 Tax=Syncephalastrum racemosum TaxID=13706 RepID=A0A1X2HNS9_SYNRA|nr:hypothetical protein BCR43DRAFT_486177 [Syncephalastrum racemosum]